MSIDSIYLLSLKGEILIEKNFKNANKREIAKTFFQEFLKSSQIIEMSYPIFRIDNHYCAFLLQADVILLAIISEDVKVLVIFNQLYIIMETLKNGFKEAISAEKIKNNFSQIAIMLDHYIDYGFTIINQKQVLESMVRPGNLISKMTEVISGSGGQQGKNNTVLLESYIEGLSDIRDYSVSRIKDIKENESAYFDVIEYLDCIILSNNKILNSEVNGEIKADCHISGVPDINLFLTIPEQLSDYSLHECLFERHESFEKEKVLSFIPPSGQSNLFYYKLQLFKINELYYFCLSIKNCQPKLPFEVFHTLKFSENAINLQIKVESRLVKGQSYIVEEFHIKLLMPIGLTLRESNYSTGIINIADNLSNILWRIGELSKDQQVTLNLKFDSSTNLEKQNFIMCLKYEIPGFSYSGLKIDKADVKNCEAKKLAKKARNLAKSGYFEYRLNN